MANAFESGRAGFEKIEKALMDVWTTIEDSISDGEIRIKSGKLIDLSAGPILTENSNIVVIDKEGFLSFYRKNKEKIATYHWDDKNKMSKDIVNIEKIYKYFLNQISKTLNDFHKTNYNLKLWEILIGRWLKQYIAF